MSQTVSLRFDDSGLRRLAELAPPIFIEEMSAGVLEASLLASREVQERTPTSGAGTLRNSIGALPITISGMAVQGGVGTALPYAAAAELGSKPHWAPLAPLVDWVERKLGKSGEEAEGIAQAIQYKIAHHGTKGAFMFREGFAHVSPQVLEILKARVDRGASRVEAAI